MPEEYIPENISDEKTQTEIKKLNLEIKNLNRPFWLQPSNLFPIFTFMVAVGTFYWGCKSGLLDNKRASLDLEKQNLQWDINKFTTAKDSLSKIVISVKDSVYALRIADSNLKKNIVGLQKQYGDLKQSYDFLKNSSIGDNEKINFLNRKNQQLLDSITKTKEQDDSRYQSLQLEYGRRGEQIRDMRYEESEKLDDAKRYLRMVQDSLNHCMAR